MTVDASLYTEDFDLERFRAGEEVYAVQTYFSNKSKRVFKYIRDDGYHLMCTDNTNLRIDLVTTKYKHLWRMKPPTESKVSGLGEKSLGQLLFEAHHDEYPGIRWVDCVSHDRYEKVALAFSQEYEKRKRTNLKITFASTSDTFAAIKADKVDMFFKVKQATPLKPSEINKINFENDRLLQVLRSMR